MIRKKGEVKILERELNQCISSYNESLACNNRLRSEIDELRKEKKNQNEAFRTLMERVAQVDKSIAEKKAVAEAKKSSIESAKEGILQLRHTNE